MKKDKKRTLRNKIPSKKTYVQKAGQVTTDFKKEQFYQKYKNQLETKRELFETIQNEGSHLFDLETSKKVDAFQERLNQFQTQINSESLLSSMESTIDLQKQKIFDTLEHYGKMYSSYFTMITKQQEDLMNELKEQNYFVKNLLNKFNNNMIHVHFLEIYFNILQSAIPKISLIEKQLIGINTKIDSIFSFIENDYKEKEEHKKSVQFKIEEKKAELESAISIVLSTPPLNIKPNRTFIQGCPFGSYLENGSCIYKDASNNQVGDSIPFQKDLVDETSDIVVWFKEPLGQPILFERKPKMYAVTLDKDDQEYFSAKYVLCESNGSLIQDKFGGYTFLTSFDCCYNESVPQVEKMDKPMVGYEYYFMVDDIPQGVELLNQTAQPIHPKNSIEKYLKITSENDQLTLGIQYVETDSNGNLILDNDKNIIPFFPELLQFKKKKNTFVKENIKYTILDNLLTESVFEKIDKSIRPKKLIFNYSNLNGFSSNLFDNSYMNSIVEIDLPKLYKPFILPFVLQNEGDYFVVHNKSDTIPLIFELSKDSSEKRVVIYPHQYYVFIFSKSSTLLNYGFLYLAINPESVIRSNKTALVNDTYVFFSDDKPIYDSDNLLIKVPNLHNDTSSYYEYDDIFETLPLKITILDKKLNIDNAIFSSVKNAYKSDFICKMNDIFIFCDSSGNPNLDIFGYVIPVPFTIEESNGSYIWDNHIVTVKPPYDGNATIDLQYTINQSGGGSVSPSYLSSIVDKVSIFKQTLQSLINKYKDVTTSINNFSDLYLQIDTIFIDLPKQQDLDSVNKMFSKAQELYNEAMKTKYKIDTVQTQEKENQTLQDQLNTIRESYGKQIAIIYQNEANLDLNLGKIKDKLDKLDENINKTQLVDDYNELLEMLNSAKQSRILLDTNMKSSNDIDYLKTFESSLLTLLNTDKSLESYIDALNSSIDKAKSDFESMLLQSNQIMLERYKNQILDESSNLDTLKDLYKKTLESIESDKLDSQFRDVYDSTKKQIELELSNISSIIEITKEPIPTVLTSDDIKSLTDKSISNILEIQNEKKKLLKNIKILEDISNKSFASNVATKKQELLNILNNLESEKQSTLNILNSLKIDTNTKKSIETNINIYEIELQTLLTSIHSSSDIDDLNEYGKRLDSIKSEIDSIQTEVQTLEYSEKKKQSGGTKNRKKYSMTRKLPKNLIIRN